MGTNPVRLSLEQADQLKELYDALPLSTRRSNDESLEESLQRRTGSIPVFDHVRLRNSDQRGLMAGNWIGVFPINGLTVEVLPKLWGTQGPDTEPEADEWALNRPAQMLQVISDRGRIASTGHYTASESKSLLECFILQFANTLLDELSKGVYHAYREVENNLNTLRGRIVFAEQIRQNAAHDERLYCRYEIFTADNSLNRLFKSVVAALLRRELGMLTRSRLYAILAMLDDVADMAVSQAAGVTIHFDRLSQRFEACHRWCQRFVATLFPSIYTGAESRLQQTGLAFDMALLFETYVEALLSRQLPSGHWSIAQQSIQTWTSDRHGNRRGIPDLVLYNGDRKPVVLDMKWKVARPEWKPDVADLRQVREYINTVGATKGYLLLPCRGENEGIHSSWSSCAPTNGAGSPGRHIIHVFTIDMETDISAQESIQKLMKHIWSEA